MFKANQLGNAYLFIDSTADQQIPFYTSGSRMRKCEQNIYRIYTWTSEIFIPNTQRTWNTIVGCIRSKARCSSVFYFPEWHAMLSEFKCICIDIALSHAWRRYFTEIGNGNCMKWDIKSIYSIHLMVFEIHSRVLLPETDFARPVRNWFKNIMVSLLSTFPISYYEWRVTFLIIFYNTSLEVQYASPALNLNIYIF